MVRVVALLVLLCSVARAQPAQPAPPSGDTVALLPLDAESPLEIYGQPVASEMARALGAGGIDVVVVGPKMAVPVRAQLVIDGTITQKHEAIALAIRIRERATGTVLDTQSASAPTLAFIDSAAAELSARVLPSVKKQLAALHEHDHPPDHVIDHEPDTHHEPHPLYVPPPPPPLVVAVTGPEPFRGVLAGELASWAQHHHHEPRTADLHGMPASKLVEPNELAAGFEVRAYARVAGKVPMARARVRVRVTDHGRVLFDRVVVTDTVVGDRASTPEQLAARVAREVAAIVEPHARKLVPAWR